MSFSLHFRSSVPVPLEYRANFRHLYLDIGWFGLLNGSAMAFLSVYAARLGASSAQIGMLGAMPALMSLTLAIPSGQWLQHRSINRAVSWTSVIYRLGYLFLIPLPWLFSDSAQIWALIGMALLMGIPGTALSVGFNAMFADAVPHDWRAHVAGIRNIAFSVVYIPTSLICGWLLDRIAFPAGYQLVFGLGVIGGMMSSYHLFHVRSLIPADTPRPGLQTGGLTRPGNSLRLLGDGMRPNLRLRLLTRASWQSLLRVDIWKTPFRRTLLVLFSSHLAHYLAIPLFSIFFVDQLHLNDQQIGIGTAAFYLTVLLGSTQLARISRRLGHQRTAGIGAGLVALYPVVLAMTHGFWAYLGISLLGGAIWSLLGGALPNYLLDAVPPDDRPASLAWYSLILNAAILIASLLGPFIASYTGIREALMIFGLLRIFGGLAIIKWG